LRFSECVNEEFDSLQYFLVTVFRPLKEAALDIVCALLHVAVEERHGLRICLVDGFDHVVYQHEDVGESVNLADSVEHVDGGVHIHGLHGASEVLEVAIKKFLLKIGFLGFFLGGVPDLLH